MNLTLAAFGPAAAPQTNAAAVRAVAAEYYVDFTAFGSMIVFELSALVLSAATPTQPAVIEAWASATEGDATGTGTLLGTVSVPALGTGGVTVGASGILVIANPGGTKYVTFTTRAGLTGASPVTLTFRGLLLALTGPDGDNCTTATTTLIKMRTGAQELSDKVNDASVSDTTWNIWVNQGVERLWELVASAFTDSFFKTYDFTLAGGVGGNILDVTTIPAGDFRRVRLLEWSPDTAARRKIRAFNWNEKDQRIGSFASVASFMWCSFRRYRLMGEKLYVEPFEQASGTYRLYYVPGPAKLVTNCDGIDPVLDEWSEFPMLYAAMKALGKEESDDGQIQTQMAAIRAAIEIAAPSRNDGDPDVIADVEGGDGGTWG